MDKKTEDMFCVGGQSGYGVSIGPGSLEKTEPVTQPQLAGKWEGEEEECIASPSSTSHLRDWETLFFSVSILSIHLVSDSIYVEAPIIFLLHLTPTFLPKEADLMRQFRAMPRPPWNWPLANTLSLSTRRGWTLQPINGYWTLFPMAIHFLIPYPLHFSVPLQGSFW